MRIYKNGSKVSASKIQIGAGGYRLVSGVKVEEAGLVQ